jgi:histidinol-phosphate aminotransferase
MADLNFKATIQQFQRPNYRATADEIAAELGIDEVVRMAANENPLGASPKVIEAIQTIAPSIGWYPASSDLRLREAVAETLGRGIIAEHIYTACSGFEVLEFVARGFLSEGDEAIVSSPTFTVVYDRIVTMQGAKIVDVPLDSETFAYDVDAVIEAITEKTKLIFVTNPNNPTGTIIPAEKMAKLMQALPEHVLVVADEVYFQFVDDPGYPDSLQYVLDDKNILIVHSFSKSYGLAGLRMGYGIAKPQTANYLAAMQRGYHMNAVSIAAGIAACQDQDHIRTVVDYITKEKVWLQEQFDRLDIRYWPSQTNFFLIETTIPAVEVTEKMKQRGVLVQPQVHLNLPYHIRASLSLHEGNIRFIDALEAILLDTEG